MNRIILKVFILSFKHLKNKSKFSIKSNDDWISQLADKNQEQT